MIPPTESIAQGAYELMRVYARSHGLHSLDALIAATALQGGLRLASKNRKHFEMIAGLELEVPGYQALSRWLDRALEASLTPASSACA